MPLLKSCELQFDGEFLGIVVQTYLSILPFLSKKTLLSSVQDPNSKHLGTTVWDASLVFAKFLVTTMSHLHTFVMLLYISFILSFYLHMS